MHTRLSQLTEAVADGQALDWSSLGGSGLDTFDRVALEELRAIAEIERSFATLTRELGGPAAVPPPPALETWAGLRIREHVGRGRFGDVFRAWDPAIDREVALKLLHRSAGHQPSEPAVIQEARLMGRVRHPNVAAIYGAAHLDGRTGLWMEFIEGRTLQAELRARGPLHPSEAAAIGVELCRALAAVHAAGLVHRDVKAQNVMREAGGRVVLGDFGTGLEIEEETAVAEPAGTPLYLAPEVWEGQPATPRSDLYSLGVLLFHLVTGGFPVAGRSAAEIRAAHVSGTSTRLSALRPDTPPGLAVIIERAIARAPADRYPDAVSMEQALNAWLNRRQPGEPSELQNARTGKRDRLTRPRLMLFAVTAAAVLLLLTLPAVRSRLGEPSRSANALAETAPAAARRLNRVPAPDARFWGQPSLDGRSFSFVSLGGELGIFDPSSGQPRLLTSETSAGGFAFETSTFSPDGRRIAFAWEAPDGTRELRVMSIEGGDPRVVWTSRDDIPHPIAWSAEHDRMLVLFESRGGQRRLGVMAASGPPVATIAEVASGFSTGRISPDGRRIVFDDLSRPGNTNRDIFLVDIDPPREITRIVGHDSDDFGPLWTPEGDRILFISDRTGEPSVWSISVRDGVSSGNAEILHRNIGRIRPNGLTEHGTLFYDLKVGLADVYEAAFDGAGRTATERVRPVAPAQVGSKVNAEWSPDGSQMLYVALPHAGTGSPNTRRLAIVDTGSGDTRLLAPPLHYYNIPRWSPDGRTILVKGLDLQSRQGLFLVDSWTGNTRTIAAVDEGAPDDIGAFQWGADERSVLFTRQRKGLFELDVVTGRERILFDFASEGITAFTPAPGFRLLPDGRSIAYSAYRKRSDGGNETVLRTKTFGQPATDVVVGPVRIEDVGAGGEILFTRLEKGQLMSLWRVRGTGSAPEPLGLEMYGLRNVTLHPDGDRILFTAGMPGSEVWALSNFLAPPSRGR